MGNSNYKNPKEKDKERSYPKSQHPGRNRGAKQGQTGFDTVAKNARNAMAIIGAGKTAYQGAKAAAKTVETAKRLKGLGYTFGEIVRAIVNDKEWYGEYKMADDVSVNMYSPYNNLSGIAVPDFANTGNMPYAPHLYVMSIYKPLNPCAGGADLATSRVYNDLRSRLKSNIKYGPVDVWNYIKCAELCWIAELIALRYLRAGITHSLTDPNFNETLGKAILPGLGSDSFSYDFAEYAPAVRRALATFKAWRETRFPFYCYAFNRDFNMTQHIIADEDSDFAVGTIINYVAGAFLSNIPGSGNAFIPKLASGQQIVTLLETIRVYSATGTANELNTYALIGADMLNAYGSHPATWDWNLVDKPMEMVYDADIVMQLRNARMEYLNIVTVQGSGNSNMNLGLGTMQRIKEHFMRATYDTALTEDGFKSVLTGTADNRYFWDKGLAYGVGDESHEYSMTMKSYPLTLWPDQNEGTALVEAAKLVPYVEIREDEVYAMGDEIPFNYAAVGLSTSTNIPVIEDVKYGLFTYSSTPAVNYNNLGLISTTTWNGCAPLQGAVLGTGTSAGGNFNTDVAVANQNYDNVAFLLNEDIANVQQVAAASLYTVNPHLKEEI